MEPKQSVMETEICHNCKREVPQANYLMHVAHCARNMTVCPTCGDAVPKVHLAEHRQQQHALVECNDCGSKMQNSSVAKHRANSCDKRTVPCQFCELELPQCELPEHENYCGSRTERCSDCNELVMLKYQKLHLDSNHGFMKLNDEPGPIPSWETSAIHTRTSQGRVNWNSISDMSPLPEAIERVTCSEKSSCKDVDGGDGAPANRENLWDAPRTLITPYDASDDLRAKVKLARHDLNNIKNMYLVNEERKGEQRGARSKYPSHLNELPATNRRAIRDKFVTNLVPYEKNKSYQVNALPLDTSSSTTTPTPTSIINNNNPTGYYNYLGAKEEAPTNLMSTVKTKSKTGTVPKKTTINGTVNKRDLGAVPRTSRKKAPAPPPPAPQAQKVPSSDSTTLPCEFCMKMIPAVQLVEHEAGCRSELNITEKPSRLVSDVNLSPDVELPCEFCFNLYPASKLLSHQALCGV